MVVRDHEGTCMYAASRYHDFRADAMVTEVMALRWAMESALQLEIDNLILETDAMEVVEGFTGKRHIAAVEPVLHIVG